MNLLHFYATYVYVEHYDNMEQRYTGRLLGVNLRDLLIFVTPTGYSDLLTLSTLLLLERTELQHIEQLPMFLQLRTAIGGTGEKQVCDGPDVVQTKDLRDKTGDLKVSELKVSHDLRGNIYVLEVHTNTFFSSSSGLTALEKDTILLFCSQGFMGM